MNKKKIVKPIDTNEGITGKPKIDYPIFCFKHLQDVSIKNCNTDIYFSLINRIRKLENLGWNEIDKSHRHSYGYEKIPVNQIKPSLPSFVSEDVEKLYAFRYTGNNLPFLALRYGNILHIIFIETKFGDIYDHE